MNYVWDILAIAIIVASVVFACRKGLISTLFGLLGTVVSLLAAVALKGVVGEFLNKTIFHAPIQKFVLGTITGSPVLNYEQSLENTDVLSKIKEMPKALDNLLHTIGISTSDVTSGITGSASTTSIKEELVNRIADPISSTISMAVAFIGLFFIFSILCIVAAKLLTALCNILPFGKKINKIGGGIAGFIKGMLLVLIISAVVSAVSIGVAPDGDSIFSEKTIQNTIVFKEIIRLNPACNLLK